MAWDWKQALKHKGTTLAGRNRWQPDPAHERKKAIKAEDEARRAHIEQAVARYFDEREAMRAQERAR